MKYKKLTLEQIKVSLDRLTRFKPPEDKYVRVFTDILSSCLIEPKLKKQEIEELNYKILSDMAVEILNNSLPEHSQDYLINDILLKYENDIFNNSVEVNKLLDNKINYKSALKYIEDKDLPLNLKWLKTINKKDNLLKLRKEKSLMFPISLVIIAEGITEEILLPEFSKILGLDFNEYGIKIIPAGGKNQVVKLYYSLAEKIKIPIFVLLDKDASENLYSINKKLRTIDEVYILNSGEFEDLLPKALILKTLNIHLKNLSSISSSDLSGELPMVKLLENIFKEKGIHEFKKAEFAKLIQKQIKSEKDISDEIKIIVERIRKKSL